MSRSLLDKSQNKTNWTKYANTIREVWRRFYLWLSEKGEYRYCKVRVSSCSFRYITSDLSLLGKISEWSGMSHVWADDNCEGSLLFSHEYASLTFMFILLIGILTYPCMSQVPFVCLFATFVCSVI